MYRIKLENCQKKLLKNKFSKNSQNRDSWRFAQKELEIDDIVALREDYLPTNEWRVGCIRKFLIGKDGHTKVAELKTGRRLIKRPTTCLIALENNEYASRSV